MLHTVLGAFHAAVAAGGSLLGPGRRACRRRRYELNPSGEVLLEGLVALGLTKDRLHKARACLNRAAEEGSRLGEPSRAVCAALNTTEKPDCTLPEPEDWRLLLSRFNRTLPGLEDSERGALRFLRAHYAVMVLRGEDTDSLLRADAVGDEACVVDMYEAVKSWRAMTKDRFVEVLHLLLYTKVIGSKGSLHGIKKAVGSLMKAYYAAMNEVRAAPGRGLLVARPPPVLRCGRLRPRCCSSDTACAQVVEDASPFQRYKSVVSGVAMFIKSSALSGVRKITPLSEGQIRRMVEGMYVGGFGMMQARVVLSLTAIAGVRSTFFQFWRWEDVHLQKVLLRDGEAVPASVDNR